MSFAVEARGLGLHYGRAGGPALDGVSFTWRAGAVHALLGRNGSGKSSLMAVVAAFRRASSGSVLVDGVDPWEDARVMAGTCLVREGGDLLGGDRAGDALRSAAALRPTWSADLAARLVDRFELPLRQRVDRLSRGQRSALAATLGLASRAPLTMMDEVTLGMDAPSRYAFYEELLADYAEHPRTIVVSTHLVEEVERLVEHVTVLHHGGVVVHAEADAARAGVLLVSGAADDVAAFTAGRRVLAERRAGRTVEAVLADADGRLRPAAERAGLEVGTPSLQDALVHLTGTPARAAEGVLP